MGSLMKTRITSLAETFLTVRCRPNTKARAIQELRKDTFQILKRMSGLAGPKGAGKSMLMGVLATRFDPDKGSIRYGHIDRFKQEVAP